MKKIMLYGLALSTAFTFSSSASGAPNGSTVVTPENFARAETDAIFERIVKNEGFGRLMHLRVPTPLDKQLVAHMNRDTLYSAGVFDLNSGPVTVKLPNSGARSVSLQVIDEDHYTRGVYYDSVPHIFAKEEGGPRYILVVARMLVDPSRTDDMRAVHELQDLVEVAQKGGPGAFDIPRWDETSRKDVRTALIALNETLPDLRGAFGSRSTTDPVLHLIGTAAGWGAMPAEDALYQTVTPERNDGKTVYRLDIGNVPVDGFWSVSVYNSEGYFVKNELNSYSLNNITARKNPNGSVTVQFGGCDAEVANCLPTMQGWTYMVRLFRPREEILTGEWTFPKAYPLISALARSG